MRCKKIIKLSGVLFSFFFSCFFRSFLRFLYWVLSYLDQLHYLITGSGSVGDVLPGARTPASVAAACNLAFSRHRRLTSSVDQNLLRWSCIFSGWHWNTFLHFSQSIALRCFLPFHITEYSWGIVWSIEVRSIAGLSLWYLSHQLYNWQYWHGTKAQLSTLPSYRYTRNIPPP